jgi:hypothetical protein
VFIVAHDAPDGVMLLPDTDVDLEMPGISWQIRQRRMVWGEVLLHFIRGKYNV